MYSFDGDSDYRWMAVSQHTLAIGHGFGGRFLSMFLFTSLYKFSLRAMALLCSASTVAPWRVLRNFGKVSENYWKHIGQLMENPAKKTCARRVGKANLGKVLLSAPMWGGNPPTAPSAPRHVPNYFNTEIAFTFALPQESPLLFF